MGEGPSRLGAVLAALLGVLIGLMAVGPSAEAVAPTDSMTTANVFGYVGPRAPPPMAHTTTERGPPATLDYLLAYDAVDRWSHGAPARPDGATIPAACDDDARFVHVVCGSRLGEWLAGGARSGAVVVETSRVAAKYGDEVAEGIGGSRTYIDLTKGGSIRNVGTNATHTEFADNLTAGGWISRTSKDGAVQIFQRDGAKYVLRERAGSYGGWTADFTPAGAQDVTLKIRLGYMP